MLKTVLNAVNEKVNGVEKPILEKVERLNKEQLEKVDNAISSMSSRYLTKINPKFIGGLAVEDSFSVVGNDSYLFGWESSVTGGHAMVHGGFCRADGSLSFANGISCYANGDYSFVSGENSYAKNRASHSFGMLLNSFENVEAQILVGSNNNDMEDYLTYRIDRPKKGFIYKSNGKVYKCIKDSDDNIHVDDEEYFKELENYERKFVVGIGDTSYSSVRKDGFVVTTSGVCYDAIGKLINEEDLENELSKYHTKDEVDTLISTIPKFKIQVVSSLPTSGESSTVYLVTSNGTSPNLYDEYIYVNSAWEKLGSQTVDLTNYALKSELFSKNYNDLTNKPTIPTKVSQLENDSGFIDSSVLASHDVEFTVKQNTYINNASPGNEISYSGWDSTDYIDIGNYDKISAYWNVSSSYNSYYDENKVYVSSFNLGGGSTVLIKPTKAKYVRFSNTRAGINSLSLKVTDDFGSLLDAKADKSDIPSEEYINGLIDAKISGLESLANDISEVIG